MMVPAAPVAAYFFNLLSLETFGRHFKGMERLALGARNLSLLLHAVQLLPI